MCTPLATAFTALFRLRFHLETNSFPKIHIFLLEASRELPQCSTLNTFFVALSFLVVCLHSVTLFVLTFLFVSHSNLLIFVLLLLCLSTILAPSCPASCQPSCSLPPSSGCIRAAWFHPFSRSKMPLRSAPRPPLLHHQSLVTGRGSHRQPL